jgi:Zinc carboxypeptidase
VPRRRRFLLPLLLALLVVPLTTASTAAAEIGPPWCGTPIPDGTAALPDGSLPTHPVGSFPHIPWYAIGCTLDSIAASSNGRMTVDVVGQSALGYDMYAVTINALDTHAQQRDFRRWKRMRKWALTDPAYSQSLLGRYGANFKLPIFIQAGIHGNESEGIDADLRLIERLATTPYGTDPDVDDVLDHGIVVFNVIHNPDGHILNQRANGNNFDLNRDWLTQSQPETKAIVPLIQKWLAPELLDQHGYVTPTLVEATTKPHNPGIEYDFWLKWNQARIDANEAAMNAVGFAITRPINDWCPEGDFSRRPDGLCADGVTVPGPAVAEGWDDWGPFYTPMYSQLVGLNGSTVEMCNSTGTACGVSPTSAQPRGRIGSRTAQYTVATSTLKFDLANRHDLMHDQLEIYRRGVTGAARPPCCPPPFDVANNWMHEYPEAYVIPLGQGQRSDAEANRLVGWLLANGIRVWELRKDAKFEGQTFEAGSYVVSMQQAFRGLADTALGIGVDVSDSISQLYAPPGAWSHGYLWGADIAVIPTGAKFKAKTNEIRKPHRIPGGLDEKGRVRPTDRYLLELDSATAVRVLNGLLGNGLQAQLATAGFEGHAAGSVVFAGNAATRDLLEDTGKANGIVFQKVSSSSLPTLEAIDRVPRIAVLTGNSTLTINQDIWSLRNLGFTVDAVSTATLNTAATDPLLNYDLAFNTGAYPSAANVTARARLTDFFARGGGYIGAGANGANFLTTGVQVSGLTAASRTGAGRSGIVYWTNTTGADSPVVGAYPSQDTAIMDPPTWFTAVPTTLTVDGRLPFTNFFAAGLWAPDAQSATAPGAPVIAHGMNTAGTARLTVFAMNPLYRADPEREWPAISSAAYWVDQ